MANQFLSLSLFIMLLSFFIILNGMSTFEASKATTALESLSSTFKQRDIINGPPPGFQAEEGVGRGEGSVLDRIDGLFNTELAGVDVQKNRLGTEMRVRITMQRFEDAIHKGGGTGGEFAPLLSSLLLSEERKPYRVDMVMNILDNPALLTSEDPAKARIYLNRIASLAADLEDMGLPKKLISAGLTAGEEGVLEILIRPYIPFNPSKDEAKE